MSDDHDHEGEHEGDHGDGAAGRVTSPMQDYSMGQVTTGFLVLLVGVAVAYLLPTLF